MHECLLCKRDMKISKGIFGSGCIKNIYSFLDMPMPKRTKLREETLTNNIVRINRIKKVNKYQKMWLTDRYLTLQYLNRIPYGNYKKITNQIDNEIKNIDQINKNEEPKSSKNMSLKQAYDLYKKSTKFIEGIKKIKEGNFVDKESLKLIISGFSYIFNIGKNSSQYEKSSFRAMQYAFWQTVIEIGGKYAELDISANLLQHSLEKRPQDLIITDGKIIKEIIKDKYFLENINKIISKYGKTSNSFTFDCNKDGNFPMRFADNDLYFALNKVQLYVKGLKEGRKWILTIRLHDKYDYSEFKTVDKYYKDTNSIPKSMLSSTLYNLAWLSVKSGVMKEYYIDIIFNTEIPEVINI